MSTPNGIKCAAWFVLGALVGFLTAKADEEERVAGDWSNEAQICFTNREGVYKCVTQETAVCGTDSECEQYDREHGR